MCDDRLCRQISKRPLAANMLTQLSDSLILLHNVHIALQQTMFNKVGRSTTNWFVIIVGFLLQRQCSQCLKWHKDALASIDSASQALAILDI